MAKIQMVCSEAFPFASTGGMANVLDALPKALARAGETVSVVMPFYQDTQAAVHDARICYERLPVYLGEHRYDANILAWDADNVTYLFVEIPELFDRPGLYGIDYQDHPDNHLRFGALCQAALGVAEHVSRPDILHCHDWQSGLVPLYVRETRSIHPMHIGTKTLFTIHNLAYQGAFDLAAAADLGLPEHLIQSGIPEFDGQLNFLKTALVTSDLLNTVSPGYAAEIQTPGFGHRLDGILRTRSDDLSGILNGVNYAAWEAASDPNSPYHFSQESLDAKALCKQSTLAELGLAESRNSRPLVSVVSRLVRQKGLDLLMQIRDELMSAELDLTLAVMGGGDPDLEEFFRSLASTYPDRVAFVSRYDEKMASRMVAGADLFLMPSRYEPCGLNQLYAMRYGTLPIVRATGGLDDTVTSDTGFKFTGDTPAEVLDCIRTAIFVLDTPRRRDMMIAAMRNDFSWDRSAREYIRLYQRLLSS